MAHDGFVPILRSGTGDEHHDRMRSRAARQGQCAREPDARRLVFHHDLLFQVRVRLLRVLRTFETSRFGQSFEDQWVGLSALLPVTGEFRAVAAEFPVKHATHAFGFEVNHTRLFRQRGDGNASVSLIHAHHDAAWTSGRRVRDLQSEPQLYDGSRFQRTLPMADHPFAGNAFGRRFARGSGLRLALQLEWKFSPALGEIAADRLAI
jgi:hypothetical protein